MGKVLTEREMHFMKKVLFMCALGLTIATSMVAGTMAIYTHTDTLTGDGVQGTAKKFFIGTKATSEIDSFKLAPGESTSWGFSMTNFDGTTVSEVNTDVSIDVNLTEIKEWKDFSVDLLNDQGAVVASATPTNGTIKFEQVNLFEGDKQKELAYSLRFTWIDNPGTLDDAGDTALVMKEGKIVGDADLPSTGITVSVTGKQHTES